jgi:anti-sigma-K factor RskA
VSETEAQSNDVIAAGELALGLVEGEERRALEERVRSDAAFAQLVAYWEERLAGFASPLESVAPRASLKRRIDKTLFETSHDAAPSLWSSLVFWRASAAVLGAVALILAASAAFMLSGPSDSNRNLIAALAPSDAAPAIVVRIDLKSGVVEVRSFALDAGDRAAELWLIPGGESPQSLGVISPADGARIALDRTMSAKIEPGALFAVSLEPPGGSPTGAPTGPVIAAGEVQEI